MAESNEKMHSYGTNNIEDVSLEKGNYSFIFTFEKIDGKKCIYCKSSVHVDALVILRHGAKVDIVFSHIGENSTSNVTYVCVGEKNSSIQLHGSSILDASYTSATVKMLAFICEGSAVIIDGGIHIKPGLQKGVGHLHEENIMLAQHAGTVRSLPRLDVRSSDVEASHGATIDRLDEVGLFYLCSKGISRASAMGLMISGHIRTAVDSFETVGNSAIHDKIMHAILPNN